MKQHALWLLLIIPLALWAANAAALEEDEEQQTRDTGGSASPTESSIEGDVNAARAIFQRATDAYSQDQYTEAAELFQQAYDTWHHPHFLYNKGQSLLRANSWQDALAAFQQYISVFEEPGGDRSLFDPLAYIQIAECHHRLGRRAEAAQAMRRYLELSPQGDLAPGVRECIQSGQPPSSVGRRDPQTVRAARQIHDQAQALYERGQHRQAAERFLEGYRRHSDITEFLYNAAAAYRAGRLWADAIRIYDQYLETPGPEPDAYIELAQCHHELRQYTQAVEAYQRYIETEPRGTFAADARQYIQTMTTVAERTGGEPVAEHVQRAQEHFDRGMEHYNAGRFQQALQEFQQADDIIPTHETMYNVGVCYVELRQWTRALTNFENTLRGGERGRDATVHMRMGQCLVELGRRDEARRHLQRFLQIANEDEIPNEDNHRRFVNSLLERCGPGSSSRPTTRDERHAAVSDDIELQCISTEAIG